MTPACVRIAFAAIKRFKNAVERFLRDGGARVAYVDDHVLGLSNHGNIDIADSSKDGRYAFSTVYNLEQGRDADAMFQYDRDAVAAIDIAAAEKAVAEGKARPQNGVPVIDPSIAALKRAEYGAVLKRQCGWVPSRRWSSEPPPEEEIACFGQFDTNEPFGNRVVVEAA